MDTLLSSSWNWENWYASSVIAEGLFASWARDKYGESVRWLPKKLKDVTWDGTVVDVKDAFVDDVRTANGQKEPCLGFMGTARGPGEEAREGVTHFGLVVRDVAEGPDLLAVTADGHMTIQTQCHFSIYLVPSDEINRFFARYTRAGISGLQRNRYQILSIAESFLVFDNHPVRD
ncbi:hypothetical protein [Rhodococcus sp. BP22]|uniref:hypothetical protein n=1 Tax=Rhodococcus sp. BP22 TaxID=2758566 RepID=UPI001647FD63|nr:hypothetical protein [Rhodococcus sp. BP22]